MILEEGLGSVAEKFVFNEFMTYDEQALQEEYTDIEIEEVLESLKE